MTVSNIEKRFIRNWRLSGHFLLDYQLELRRTVVRGLSNIHSDVYTVTLGVTGLTGLVIHFTLVYNNEDLESQNVPYDHDKIPAVVLLWGFLLSLWLQLSYYHNTALRRFAVKFVKRELSGLVNTFRGLFGREKHVESASQNQRIHLTGNAEYQFLNRERNVLFKKVKVQPHHNKNDEVTIKVVVEDIQ